MKTFKTPKFLFEVFGERQSVLEIACTLAFAVLGSLFVFYAAGMPLDSWRVAIAFVLIADVFAGCIANFSLGTNEFYARRPKNRLVFISVHVHIVVIAWLLQQAIGPALVVWGYTISAAFFVNALQGKSFQGFVAANLMCCGLLLLISLPLPSWFLMVSVMFMIKVVFSFSVDHFGKAPDGQV